MKLISLIGLFLSLSAFVPRGDNTILLIGDSTLEITADSTSWGDLVFTDPPKGYRVEPSGQRSGIAPPVSGNVTAVITYGGRRITHWYDGSPSAERGCYWIDDGSEFGEMSLFGCLEIYSPDIVLISMMPNDIFNQYLVYAGGFPDNMEGEYFAAIDYIISCGAKVIYVTTYPLGTEDGTFTLEQTTYRIDGSSPSDIWPSGNQNMRVFFNRMRNHYEDNSNFFMADLNWDIRTDYPDTTEWSDVCLDDLHIINAPCQASTWERVKRLISAMPNTPIPASAFIDNNYL